MAITLLIFIALLPLFYLFYLIYVYTITDVPYVRTPKKYLPVITKALNIDSKSVILDLGCGKGDFLFMAEKLKPRTLIGYDLSIFHIIIARLKAKLKGSQVKYYYKNFFDVNLSQADIIYIYLVSSVIKKLWPKIKKECRPGTKIAILSNKIHGEKINKHIHLPTRSKRAGHLNIYQL